MVERRVMVHRAGIACVPAETDDEALDKAMKLRESDFAWESMQDCTYKAKVIETLIEGVPVSPAVKSNPTVPEAKRNLHDSRELTGGYVLLPVHGEFTEGEASAIKEYYDTSLMYAAISRDSLKRYLGENTTDEELEHWLSDVTCDETKAAYEFALLDEGVAFTWDELRDEPFEVVGIDSFQEMQAAMDFISGKMQEYGLGDASMWLDCLFEL